MNTFFKTTLLAGAVAIMAASANQAHAQAACGWYAFAMATKSERAAVRMANRVGGRVFDVDASNSPNAGQGWWTVARGPSSKSRANRARRDLRARGARGAYIGHRCFYDTPRTGY
ncbi:SPOR domain-containing protein [Pseudahrensia aquimaris]|uniref:SPOR domain-containing protein n=1 Tax=Pseudahrensia aquimaris TaxID=744461 RepID=A0ABW3FCY6_9HYPH